MAKRKCQPPGIVINRMFTGNYLFENLGHEIINIFRADNGNCYLYLNPYGNVHPKYEKVHSMLMVRGVGSSIVEVIGLATGLTLLESAKTKKNPDSQISDGQYQFIIKNDIKYGGVSLTDIFGKDEQQDVFITYTAESVRFPKEDTRIFICYKDSSATPGLGTFVKLKDHNFPKQSLRNFIMSGDGDDYDRLMKEIVENDSLWDNAGPEIVNYPISHKNTETPLFQILGIQDRENCYTNCLGFLARQFNFKKLWVDFFKQLDVKLNINFDVKLEVDFSLGSQKDNNLRKGRIDLLLEDENNVVVIENKIKSDINTSSSDKEDQSQLDRYKDYIEENYSGKKNKKYFILSPEYNNPKIREDLESYYTPISYKELYKFLNEEQYKKEVDSDTIFRIFKEAIRGHISPNPNNNLFEAMLKLFYERIETIRNSKRVKKS